MCDIDGFVGAERAGEVALGVGGGGGDDVRAGGRGELDEQRADAARRRQDEHAVTGP